MPSLRTPRRAVAAMFILNGGLLGIWASRIPAIKETHGLDAHLLGLLLLCLAAGAIVSFPIAGRLSDHFGAARITRAIALVYTLALVLLGGAPSVALLALCLFLFGMAHGSMDVTMNVWATEVERAARRPLMASFHAMFSLGAGLGAGLGFFAIRAGIDVPTHFAAAGTTLALLCLYFASANWTSNRSTSKGGSLFAFPKGLLALVGLVAFAAAMGEGAVADWGAVFLKSALGTTEAQATLGYTAFSLAIFATRMTGDRIIRHFGPARTARASGFAAMAGVLIVVASGALWHALAGFALMGLGYAVLFPLAFSRAAADSTTTPGRAIASVATLGYGGLLLGPPLIGFLAEATTLRASLAVLALLAGIIVAFAPHLAPPKDSG